MVNQLKLDFWIKNRLNVLFEGKHGVGKTAIITQAFDRAGLKWKYFSAATMDPWVDFIGVPKEVQNGDGSYLELVRPKEFQRDEIEAIFFDEFNRSAKKVRNAVMELIQFKSINGKKFNNLKIIWAAVNPDDDADLAYDVDRIDPAQLDRFQIHINIPYEPFPEYFVKKYGESLALPALEWWTQLSDKFKIEISPRRLDYALDIHRLNGDIRDILPVKSNIGKLLTSFKTGPVQDKLDEFVKTRNIPGARAFLADENSFASAIGYIMKVPEYCEFFIPLMPCEKISSLMATENDIFKYVIKHFSSDEGCRDILKSIIEAKSDKMLIYRIEAYARRLKQPDVMLSLMKKTPTPPYSNKTSAVSYAAVLANFKASKNTYERQKQWFRVRNGIPQEQDLSLADAEATLKIANEIAHRSKADTVRNKMQDFTGVLNHCIETIIRLKKVDDKNYNGRSFFSGYYKKYRHALDWGISETLAGRTALYYPI